MKSKTSAIVGTAAFTIILVFLLALWYLGYLVAWQLALFIGIMVFVVLIVLGLYIFVRRTRENNQPSDTLKQQITREEAKKLAVAMVLNGHYDHLTSISADEIVNIGFVYV